MYKVIIIDDEPIIVKGLKQLVPWETYDCQVVGVAYDGQEGLELIRKVQPDIVFSDIYMPKMDGLMMTAALKSEFEDMEMTILTGYRDFELVQQALYLGVARFILKPSNMEELEEALQAMTVKLRKRGITPEHSGRHGSQRESSAGENRGSQGEHRAEDEQGNCGRHETGEASRSQSEHVAGEASRSQSEYAAGEEIGSKSEHAADGERGKHSMHAAGEAWRSQGEHIANEESGNHGAREENGRQSKSEGQESTGESPAGSFIVKNALAFMRKNYNRKITLKEVADNTYVSQWHLSKLLNKHTGQSFSELLNTIRVEEAKKLLKNPALRIGDVADEVGFLDMAHFSRVFKKITGMSANEYRNRIE